MNKLFVQWCAILLLLLMRRPFQTGSPCFPFPVNSKIHNPIQVTVISGWHSQKFAYPEDKPCSPCPEVISGLQQRRNIWSSADCWVNKSFTYWEKRQWSWDCQRDFPAFSVAPRHSLPAFCFTGAILTLSISAMIHSSFRRVGFWDWLLNACFDLDWPIALGISLLWLCLSAQRSCSSRRILAGCEGPQDEPETRKLREQLMMPCWSTAYSVPDEFWLTQAQWHKEVWETWSFLGSFSLPHPCFHHKDGLFHLWNKWFTSNSDSGNVLNFCTVQNFSGHHCLIRKHSICLIFTYIYMSQCNVTLWNLFLSDFENQSHKCESSQ